VKKGKLFLVGFGPGSQDHLTQRAKEAIAEAEIIIGYTTYIRLVKPLCEGKEVIYTGMTEELARARKAVDMAYAGKKVALVSSGDVGIYGMAGPAFECLKEKGWKRGGTIDVEVVPGVTAGSACASIMGAPLSHDFCNISLSDLLTPWEVIKQRLEAAAKADFVTVLYNPKSGRRTKQIVEAQKIFLQYRKSTTPVALVKSAYRDLEQIVLTDLDDMLEHEIGMLTTVIIGNKMTFTLDGLMITPRGYQSKYQLDSLDEKSVQLMREKVIEAKPAHSLKTYGTFYGIGVGPGYTKYLTLQARDVIEKVRYLFYPRGNATDESLALNTIEPFMRKDTQVEELMFPMTTDRNQLEYYWNLNAKKVADILKTGADVAFVTLGDATLYSTYIYIVKTLKELLPTVPIETIPGISAFSAAAAMINQSIGEGKGRVAILPVNRDVSNVQDALENFDTIVLMKVGSKLNRVVKLLEEMKLIDNAVLLSYIGTEDERVERDLKKFRNQTLGYMTLVLVKKNEQFLLDEDER